MSESIKIDVKEIIGTGDPFDRISLIPLISQWRVPRECVHVLTGDSCDAPLSRLYVLNEKVQGFSVVGACEEHHQEFIGRETP